MKSFFVISLLLGLCEAVVGLSAAYIYVPTRMTWGEARKYCKQRYTDLAKITTEEEYKRLLSLPEYFGWIGLHRPSSGIWLWSDGDPNSLKKWAVGFSSSQYNCVYIYLGAYYNTICSMDLGFFCHKRLILVKENKTWDEALEYCQINYTGLASLTSESQLNVAQNETAQSQTVSVWTGLRCLDGKWFWLDEEPLENVPLPSCPARPYRCGARNFNATEWENRDCNEKLNFLCY